MNTTKISKKIFASGLALSMVTGGIVAQVAPFAQPTIIQAATANPTPGGVATLGNGSASIVIRANEGQSLIGKKFMVYKLFNAENAEGNESINYTFNDVYKPALQKIVGEKLNKPAAQITEYEVIDYIQSLNNNKIEGAQSEQTLEGRYSDFRYFVEELRDTMSAMGLSGEEVNVTDVDSNGNITIGGLEYGYYLTDEISMSQGTHSASSLVLMNTANPNAAVQIKSDYPSMIKKINEDDSNTGWNDIGDYEIGQTVPFKFESKVPDMNGYHTYFFAFHDKMDKALTFHKDSVSVTIKDGKKSYTLQPTEYAVLENSVEDTFRIDIADLKKIVDREFAEGMNNNHENIYGQDILVTYNATLNENAALDTGRPGFENTTRLEFSNNPDKGHEGETGTTPWDTVVCFTYKLNVTKLNDHQKELKGAKFRLYSDKDCTEEVYVKGSPNGYIVINRDKNGGTDHTGGTRPQEAIEMESPENGQFTIFGLDQGTYWLKETKAPAGYRQLLDPIELNLKPTFTTDRQNYVAGDGATDKTLQALDISAHIKEFYDGQFTEKDHALSTDVADGSGNLTVVNKVGSKLPVTGSNMTLILLGAGIAIMTTAYAMNKKSTKEE